MSEQPQSDPTVRIDFGEFVCDEEGCETCEARLPTRPEVPIGDTGDIESPDTKPPLRGIYTEGGRGFINPANGRAVRYRLVPVEDHAGLFAEMFFCFDGNPADPKDRGSRKYEGVNRGVVESREEAEAWLRGKWPAGLIFVEGVSEKLKD